MAETLPEVPEPNAPALGVETEAAPRGFLPGVLRYFLVPLVLVGASLAIFAGLGTLVERGRRTDEDLLRSVVEGGKNARWQDAMELSNRVAADPALARDERLLPNVVEAFTRARREGDDPRIVGYLSRFLAASRTPSARAALEEALADGSPDVRVYVAWALGEVGDPGSLAALLPRLKDLDAGVRSVAAWAVASLVARAGDVELSPAGPALREALGDTAADVRWNAALGLARLRLPGGEDILWRLLHRDYVRASLREAPSGVAALVARGGTDPATQEEREAAVVRNALSGAYRLRDRSMLEGVRRIAAEDADLGVREFALQAVRAIEEETKEKGPVPQRAWRGAAEEVARNESRE